MRISESEYHELINRCRAGGAAMKREYVPVLRDNETCDEDTIQAAYFTWAQHPVNMANIPALEAIYAIPNAAKRTARNGAKMKATGTTAGMPDVHIPIANARYSSFYIEFKRFSAYRAKNNSLSNAQIERIELLRRFGNRVEVVWNLKDAIQFTRRHLGYE